MKTICTRKNYDALPVNQSAAALSRKRLPKYWRSFMIMLALLPTIGVAQNDVGVTAINDPQSGCQLGFEAVQVEVFNYGASIGLATFDVTYVVDGTTTTSQSQVFTSFNTNETRTVTFTIPADLSTPGPHTIDVFTELASDVDNSNDTLSIIVTNYAPTVGGTLLADDTVCQGATDTLMLTGNTGQVLGWEYSDDNGSSWVNLSNTDSFLIYSNAQQTRQYRVLVQNGTCASDYSSVATITVDQAPDAGTLGNSSVVCASGNGDLLQLTGYSGNIEKWQIDNGSGWVDISNTTDTMSYQNLTQTTLYRVVVGNGVCIADTSNIVTITVVSGSVGGNVMSSDSVCESSNGDTLQLTGYTGNVVQWEMSTDGGGTWIPVVNTTDQQPYSNLSQTTLYRVLVEASGCAPVYSDTATITVIPPALGGFVMEDKSICGGANTDTLYLMGYMGDIVKWQFDDGNGWTDISNTSDTLIVNNITVTTSYRAIVTNATCPNDTSDVATLTVIATTIGGNVLSSDSVCAGSNSGTLNLTGHIGDIRWWEQTTDNGVTWSPIANIGTQQGFVDLTETTWYRVLVDGSNCPSRYSDTAIITAYTPNVDVTANGPTEFCDGDSVELEATQGFVSYLWNTGDTNSTTMATTDGFAAVTVEDARGCVTSDSLLITVNPLPQAEAGEDQTISLGESVQLNGSGGTSYMWTPAESLDDPTTATPFATPEEDTQYMLVVTDDNGCENTDSVMIIVNKDYLFKPNNTITPNGDGFNDTWIIDNIHAYPEATVLIMNRYGELVYEQQAYDNSWDGTSNGQRLADGTYYYVITAEGSEIIYKGHLTILSK